MPDGEMRRPPQLWEQRLARLSSVLGVASGSTTSLVDPTPPPGSGGGDDPGPVVPAPVTGFTTPSTPTLSGTVQGIRVSWDGKNTDGTFYPPGAYVEVHISTSGATFTPTSETLAGTLLGSAGFFTIGGLTAGTTYYVRLVGVNEAGTRTEPSTAASGQTGLTTSSDYGTATINAGAVTFNARQIGGVTSTVGTATPTSPVAGDIWLDTTGGATTHKRYNGTTWETILFGSGSIATGAITEVKIDTAAVTAAKLAGSAVTETKIASDAVTSPKIVAGAVSAAKITAGAVTAEKIASGAVETDKLAANAVTAGKIAANTITASQIAANTITASQIASNTITATQIAAGAITAGAIASSAITTDKLDASAVTADKIAASAITADKIDANAITGKLIRTATSGKRIEIQSSGTYNGEIEFYNSSNVKQGSIYGAGSYLIINPPNGIEIAGNTYINLNYAFENLGITRLGLTSANQYGFRVASSNGAVYSYGIDEQTTGSAANVRIGVDAQLLKSTSTIRLKDELAPLSNDIAGVPPEKITSTPPSVDPYDVLTLTTTEFRSLSPADGDARMLGFIAEDVAEKLPWAANWDDDGLPSAVEDRPILAALLHVVKEQQQTITDLRSRIEALEA